MKYIICFIFLSISCFSYAESKFIDQGTMQALEATEVISVTESLKVGNKLQTPYVIRFVKNKDVASSCALLSVDESKKIYEMISPTDGMLGNCHGNVNKPLVTSMGNQKYATYIYSIEDPRKEFTTTYQVVQLQEKGFNICKQDSELSKSIETIVASKNRLAVAVSISLKRLGCTISQTK
jgi:hypothetical protein